MLDSNNLSVILRDGKVDFDFISSLKETVNIMPENAQQKLVP